MSALLSYKCQRYTILHGTIATSRGGGLFEGLMHLRAYLTAIVFNVHRPTLNRTIDTRCTRWYLLPYPGRILNSPRYARKVRARILRLTLYKSKSKILQERISWSQWHYWKNLYKIYTILAKPIRIIYWEILLCFYINITLFSYSCIKIT